jgi:hypothetical protein
VTLTCGYGEDIAAFRSECGRHTSSQPLERALRTRRQVNSPRSSKIQQVRRSEGLLTWMNMVLAGAANAPPARDDAPFTRPVTAPAGHKVRPRRCTLPIVIAAEAAVGAAAHTGLETSTPLLVALAACSSEQAHRTRVKCRDCEPWGHQEPSRGVARSQGQRSGVGGSLMSWLPQHTAGSAGELFTNRSR